MNVLTRLPYLAAYCKLSKIDPPTALINGRHTIEFGNVLPYALVDKLVQSGANVETYRHKGTVATVVSFPANKG